ncbi:MAG: tail fiber domain-containing protein, partial [Bacteriovorax sp.]|nr:tail fiber domain-containing protein [Bacteriovorax sp.]
ASGATSLATDKSGGNLVLSGGTSTGTGTSSIQFQTSSAGASGTIDNASSTKMTILGNGNVGIGTETPGALLNLVKADSTGLTDFLINPTVKTSGNLINAQVGGTSKFSVSYSGAVAGLPSINFGTGGSILMNSGGVSIGTNGMSVGSGTTNSFQYSSSSAFFTSGGSFSGFSSSNSFTGNLFQGTYTGTSSGNAAKFSIANASATGTALVVSTTGTGNAATFMGGNVGIGTTTPGALLEVKGITNTPLYVIRNDANDLLSNVAFLIRRRSDAVAPGTGFGGLLSFALEGFTDGTGPSAGQIGVFWENAQTDDTASRNSALAFYTMQGNTSSKKMTITSAGNIGIGTISPVSQLDVNGALTIEPGCHPGWVNGVNIDNCNGGTRIQSINSSIASDLIINQSGGNVGIGTTAPLFSLEVNGRAKAISLAVASTVGDLVNNAPWYGIGIHNTLDLGGGVGNTLQLASWGGLNFQTGSGAMVIKQNGNVGIGTTSPSALLHVGSTSVGTGVAVAKFQNIDGTCTMTPASAGSGIACSSDERLKENIDDVTGQFALDHILKLQAVTYNFKTDSTGKRHTGYLAQATQKVAPEFVRKNDDGLFQVYYDGLIPWITEAIKTLDKRLTALFKASEGYSRDIASMKSENTQLKANDAAKDQEILKLKKDNAEIKERLNKIDQMLLRNKEQGQII